VLAEQSFGTLADYSPLSVEFESGANTSVETFAGLTANGDSWIQVDDVSLVLVP
jgi:hypothetical protein